MKVILVNKFWYQRGGTERVVFATKKLLEDAGHQVEIFGMKHPKNIFENKYFVDFVDYDTVSGWAKIMAGFKAIYNFDARNKFGQLIKDFRPDVVHFHNIYHQLSFSLLDVVKKYHVSSIMTLHDYKLISPNYNLFHHGRIDGRCRLLSNCMESWTRTLTAKLEMFLLRIRGSVKVINLFISPSRFLKNKFVSAGFDEKKIVVLSNPVARYAGESATEGGYVAFVGRLAKEKGIDILLDAAEKTPEIKYKIIGDGPVSRRPSNVEFCGYKTGAELQSLIARADFLIAPSVWYENCPLSILDAKSAGKVVIGSRIGGIPELLPEELLFIPGDVAGLVEKIRFWHVASEDTRRAVGERMKKEVEKKNSPEKYYQRLVDVYEKVLAHI